MRDLIGWNVSSQRKHFRDKEVLFVSIPKCGRTWLRVFLNAYYNRLYRGEHPVNLTDSYPDPRPRYLFTHDRFEHVNDGSLYDYLRGKYLSPARLRRRARVVLIARDLRDVMVSLYFQHTKRSQSFHGAIDELLRDRYRGVDAVVGIMNRWAREFPAGRRLIARYEDWQIDARAGFGEVLEFISDRPVDPDAFEYALDYARFDRMQAREADNRAAIKALRPGDVEDEESFKSRRGVVGGYKAYLDDAQSEYIRARMAGLDPVYGYSV